MIGAMRGPGVRGAAVAAGVSISLAFALVVLPASPSHAFAGWSRIPHDEAVFGGTDDMTAFGVASGGSSVVAVGHDSLVDAAAVWWSTDGVTWERAVHMEGMFGGADSQYMEDVCAGPGNMVAVGYTGTAGNYDAAVWTGGGPIWKRVEHDPAVFGGADVQRMIDVAAAGPGVVAVGYDGSGGDNDAAVWVSDWGSKWTRVTHVEAVFGGSSDQRMNGVAAGGPGVVAVGHDHDVNAAAVWTSVDGNAWTRVPHDEAVFGGTGYQGMNAVTAGGPGLVAVGVDYSGGDVDAAVWTSVDGLSWSRIPHVEAVFGGADTQNIQDVTVAGTEIIAVGIDGAGGDVDAAVWTSGDGLTWTRVPHSEAVFGGAETETMYAVAVHSTGDVIAVGDQWAPYDSDVAVWTYTAPTPPPPPPEPSPTTTAGVIPTTPSPTTTVDATPTTSPGSTPTFEPSPAPSSSETGGRSVGLTVVLGSLAALILGGLGWVWLRRRP